ncbi:hypothetical protein TDB9533_04112 [Thalassocella blandensis]|nr:hypothetical protein TDB9533_04112 [Thalassocella blandensis]
MNLNVIKNIMLIKSTPLKLTQLVKKLTLLLTRSPAKSSRSITSHRSMLLSLRLFVSFFLVLFSAATFAFIDGLETTNTNQCVTNLGGIQACQDRGLFGLPNDIHGCCDGVRQLAVDQCECNQAIDVLLGVEGSQIYDIEPLCRIVQPIKWLSVKPRVFRNCKKVESHYYGCEVSDTEIDAARLSTILALGEQFSNIDDENTCLDTPAFVDGLATVMKPDAEVYVPYGIGTYKGLEDVAEYLGIAFAGLNHAYWLYDSTVDPTKKARLEVSADGKSWIQGSTQQGSFLRGLAPYTDKYLEQIAEFENCETLMTKYSVQPTEGLRDWIETFVNSVDMSERWGVRDICRYHTEFCAGDPTTEQYSSEEECVEYLSSLPLYTEACGQNRPLNGHSRTCKFKHHFMIPTNPGLHCPHIGPLGAADPNMHYKCDDITECSSDEGQDSWPLVQKIGTNTPQDIIDLYQESNIGAENEPFGCAIPTDRDGHSHH